MLPVGTNLQLNKFPKATLVIIAINVVFFLTEIALPEPMLRAVVDNFGYGTGNWYNPVALITHMFLHGSIYHIAFNMLFLWIFGAPVEERVGSGRFVAYYFISGCGAGFLQTALDFVSHPGVDIPLIGASGAISGVMALFLYRCFYSKMKMVIAPILLPRQFEIPVVPLVALWFLQNVLMGFVSLVINTGVGHWAHVGGFVVGIVIGRVKRYGQEGQVENLRMKALKKLEDGKGWAGAKKDLEALLKVAPDDPEVNHDLARLNADSGDAKAAERYYQKAVQLYTAKDPLSAAYMVLECSEAVGKPMSIQAHVKAAEALCAQGDMESAKKALAPYSSELPGEGPLHERALALNARILRHLGDKDAAFEAVGLLLHKYPDTKFRQEVRRAMLLEPGSVFAAPAPPPAAAGRAAERAKADEALAANALGTIEMLQRYFIDPTLWAILLFLNIAVSVIWPEFYNQEYAPPVLFVLAYVFTIVHRMGGVEDFIGSFLYFGKSDKQAHRDFDIKKNYNDALMAEKGAKYEMAASLYEEVLRMEPDNAQARFNLARLYHVRLEDLRKARGHYNFMIKQLPEAHPFNREAKDAMRAMSK